jgi:pimeloyl-ACP methyl ester carboxylesterase
MKSLAGAGYRAVAPFMRGYSPSGLAPDGDYRIITLARDVLALIEALGAQRAAHPPSTSTAVARKVKDRMAI